MSHQNVERTFLSIQEEIIITPDNQNAPGSSPNPETHHATTALPAALPSPSSSPPLAPSQAPPTSPSPEEDEPPLHLPFPAPIFTRGDPSGSGSGSSSSSATHISKWGMRLPGFSAEWQTRGETQCIRCKITAVSRTIAINIPGIRGYGAAAGEFTLSRSGVHADLEVGGQKVWGHAGGHVVKRSVLVPVGVPVPGTGGAGGTGAGGSAGGGAVDTVVGVGAAEGAAVVEHRRDGVLMSGEMDLVPLGFRYEKSVAKPGEVVLVSDKIPPYVVLGIFSGADGIPHERMISIRKPSWLFWYMFWAVVRLRGISWIFSLKDVKGFAVYRCNWKTGVHKQITLEQKGINDLRLLLLAYKSWWNSDRIGVGWTTWFQKTINNGSSDPRASPDGNALSIEVVLGWSASRISVVILLPTVLSLVIGLWFNSRDWNDLSTIQSAWGIASYVATAGGLIAALLAIVSGISDK